MEKNDIFTFTTSDRVELIAIVLDKQLKRNDFILVIHWYLCYAQNRLFYCIKRYFPDMDKTEYEIGNTIVDHVIIPDYDRLLARYNDIEVAQTETNIGM